MGKRDGSLTGMERNESACIRSASEAWAICQNAFFRGNNPLNQGGEATSTKEAKT